MVCEDLAAGMVNLRPACEGLVAELIVQSPQTLEEFTATLARQLGCRVSDLRDRAKAHQALDRLLETLFRQNSPPRR